MTVSAYCPSLPLRKGPEYYEGDYVQHTTVKPTNAARTFLPEKIGLGIGGLLCLITIVLGFILGLNTLAFWLFVPLAIAALGFVYIINYDK